MLTHSGSVSAVKCGWLKPTFLHINTAVFMLAVSSLVRESYGSAVFMADYTTRLSVTVKPSQRGAESRMKRLGQSQVSISLRNATLTMKYFG